MTTELDSLIRSVAPLSDAEALRPVPVDTRRELLEQITAADTGDATAARSPRARRRWTIGLPVAAAAACAVAVTALLVQPTENATRPHPGPSTSVRSGTFDPRPVAALSFVKRKDHIEVRIKDPLADPRRYEQEFAAHGMKITLSTVPASPSAVGTIVAQDGDDGPDTRRIETIEEGRCVTGGGGDGKCLRGLRIPIGYRNTTGITFGREARPGEQYSSTNSAFAPGEVLHCFDVRGLTVEEADRRLKQREVTATMFHWETSNYGYTVARDKLPGNWYVTDADPWAPGQVMLSIQKDRPVIKNSPYWQALFKGC
ncbi:hypothetical protein BZB76_5522 [Actinomadura pelletieri DSM 43383]|uniref:Uncharacterized protein n=1 Tax=Actinomadura pelletieri DSM 43383 TaxID=1120940 RepID=A0A495QGJ6_9ACTN|nr:hypothetical protein [Actinomadura pelletieri]RKS71040.1 hypothetical protein BZB76_5522 [Actinomadura pelletieri DSM 43383]